MVALGSGCPELERVSLGPRICLLRFGVSIRGVCRGVKFGHHRCTCGKTGVRTPTPHAKAEAETDHNTTNATEHHFRTYIQHCTLLCLPAHVIPSFSNLLTIHDNKLQGMQRPRCLGG
jgi:hypothetical protein